MINTTWPKAVLKDFSDVKDKRVIARLDLNLPISDGKISDLSRLKAILPFVDKLCFNGAKVIIIAHLGEKGESIKPVADLFIQHLPFARFFPSLNFEEIQTEVNNLKSGEIIMLENIRMFPGETDNTPSLAKNLAALGDIYINDAFSVSHREHASIVGVPKHILSYFGPTFEKELVHLSKILTPKKPALLILGGSKISTKMKLIKRYLDQGIKVFVGGALAHNIFKQRGYEIGESLYDKDIILPANIYNHPDLVVPIDVVLEGGEQVRLEKVPNTARIMDCGERTLTEVIDKLVKDSNTIIMNGPLGLYEMGYMHGTERTLAFMSQKPRESTYIGGGDTVSAASSINALDNIGYVSLGGGAMLEYLANGTLPGIDAVTK